MNTNDRGNAPKKQIDPIDDYLECVTFCSVSNRAEENDCQTISIAGFKDNKNIRLNQEIELCKNNLD